MATYEIYLVDQTQGEVCKKNQALLVLEHAFLSGRKTWKIDQPNGWIGTGSGEYSAVSSGGLVNLTCSAGGTKKLALWLPSRYPDDIAKDNLGSGEYSSSYLGGTRSLAWYSGNQPRPDSC